MTARTMDRDGIPSAVEHAEEARATSANPSTMDQVHAVAHAVLALGEAMDRQARALERIADRLDSWHGGSDPATTAPGCLVIGRDGGGQ